MTMISSQTKDTRGGKLLTVTMLCKDEASAKLLQKAIENDYNMLSKTGTEWKCDGEKEPDFEYYRPYIRRKLLARS